MHDEPRNELERRALAAWTPQEPPPGFVDRVLAADARLRAEPVFEAPDLPPPGRRWSGLVAAAVAVALAGSVAAMTRWPGAAPLEQPGASEPDEVHDPGAPVSLQRPEAPVSARPPAASPADLGARIDAYLEGFGRHYGEAFKLHGSVVVMRDGEALYQRGLGVTGLQDGQAITPDTRFKIGSLTQQFIAVAILQLRDAGKLGLDDPLKRHLRDYPAVGATITLRQLLSHTSGIPNYTEDLPAVGVLPGRAYPPRKLRASFEALPLEFSPGTDFDPSNSGYLLLGLVIERVSGRPLGDYLRDNIVRPAGMRHTALLDVRARPGAPMAGGHAFSEDEVLVPVAGYDLSVYGGAAGMVASASDLARFDRALRVPGLLLSGSSLAEMYTPVRKSYGLGWVVQQDHGQTMVGHPGGVEGFNAAWLRYLGPEAGGLTVIALANTEAVDCRQIAHDLAALALGERVTAPLEHVETPVSPAMFSRYLGDYSLSDRSREQLAGRVSGSGLDLLAGVHVYEDAGRLFMLVPLHGAKWLHASGPDQFFFKDPAGTLAQFGPPGAPVETLTLRQGELEFTLVRGEAASVRGSATPALPVQLPAPARTR